MIEKIKTIDLEKIKRYTWGTVIIIMLVYRGYYVSLSARNLVFMDFWRNVCLYIEPVMTQKHFPWGSFFQAQFGQRNFFQLMLVSFDIKYTNLNCLWESYAGILVIGLIDLVILKEWNGIIAYGNEEKTKLGLIV